MHQFYEIVEKQFAHWDKIGHLGARYRSLGSFFHGLDRLDLFSDPVHFHGIETDDEGNQIMAREIIRLLGIVRYLSPETSVEALH